MKIGRGIADTRSRYRAKALLREDPHQLVDHAGEFIAVERVPAVPGRIGRADVRESLVVLLPAVEVLREAKMQLRPLRVAQRVAREQLSRLRSWRSGTWHSRRLNRFERAVTFFGSRASTARYSDFACSNSPLASSASARVRRAATSWGARLTALRLSWIASSTWFKASALLAAFACTSPDSGTKGKSRSR